MKVRYEELKEICDHLTREHNLPDSCQAMKELVKLWSRGCNEEVAKRGRND